MLGPAGNSQFNQPFKTKLRVSIEVSRRSCHELWGAGHFMLAPAGEDFEVFIDPHNNGEILFLEDAAEKLASVYGMKVHHDTLHKTQRLT
jgi:hypothetical protein